MVRKEFKLQRTRTPGGLAAELALLSEEMQKAFIEAYRAYSDLNIRFAVAGGLAAGAYGEPRNTKDIDFLVGDEAFVKTGFLISFAKPLPLQAYSVSIDPIPLPEDINRWTVLDNAVTNPYIDTTLGFPILLVPPTALAYMKLASPRAKDRGDIVTMLEAEVIDLDILVEWIGEDEVLQKRLNAALEEAAATE